MSPAVRRSGLGARILDHRWHYLFLLPMLVLFAMFTLWPMIASWYYAFFDWDGVGSPTDWVGWQNFVDVASNPVFWRSFKNSFLFSLVALVVQMPLSLLFAILLNNPRLRGRSLFRLLLFVPVVTTTAVIGIVLAVILDASGGTANEILGLVGVGPFNFLGSEAMALPTLMVIETWKGFGITLIYWLAALQTVPTELYEAARTDGAGGFQQLLHVTVPVIIPIAIVILVLTFQSSMNPFDLIQATTRGGPNLSTDVTATFIYRYAFDPGEEGLLAPRLGYASAAGVIFGVATLMLTLLQAPLLRGRYGKKAR
ncbi:carbohydrate ABC transporter permease [Propionibacteriaceae bacterium Y2011]|uniref:carbohydrate ABC transporter permease n=1 Tax=Microlunatus sp. Y2014 TaxID=3418488 RepID=UPI003B4F4EA8